MPSYVPPKKNIEYIIYVSLVSQANLKIFQVNPTLAAGDVKVSTDGGAEGNIATLPVVTPASSKRVKITLSTSEMNGDNVQVTLSDVSGDEWCDLTLNIQSTANQIDEIAGSGFVSSTDSNEAIRDRGDAAWITGGGAGITDILNLQPIIPASIDIANTATVRLSLMLINSLDDLPSTAEITPGTISIDRKAIGGTSWSNIVSNDACSEKAGEIYYDEVFDSGTGYAEGDSIRITFKSQKITVSANDYEITDATGVMFQTEIRQTMRGTELAALASALATAQTDLDTITGADGTTLATSQGNYAPAKVGDNMNLADDAITNAKYDESTAFPVKSDDSGSTEIARTGADGDTLETLSDQADLQATLAICTEARLAELDAANIPADIDTLLTRLTDARAQVLSDWIDGGRLDLLLDAIKAVTDFLVVKKNTAKNNFSFPMVLSSDHISDADSKTVTCQRSIDGGAYANCTVSTATFISAGTYKVNLSASDLNGDVIILKFTAPDSDARKILVLTIP